MRPSRWTRTLQARDERHMPLCSRGALADLWLAHGLRDVDEQPLTIDMAFTSFDDYWQPFLRGQGPAGGYVVVIEPIRPARTAIEVASAVGGRWFPAACARMGGTRHGYLSALANSRQSCGSALMVR